MKNLNNLRRLFSKHLNAFFDELERSSEDTQSATSLDYIDDDSDYESSYEEGSISASDLYEAMQEEYEDSMGAHDDADEPAVSWPNVSVPSQGSRAETTQQPSIQWPNVAAPAPAKPKWPLTDMQTGDVVGIFANGKVGKSQVASIGVVASTPTPTGKWQQIVDTDGRGRACVPTSLAQRAGFNPGDFVYVSVRAHKQPGLVLLASPSKTGHLSTYIVDKDGNIRLSHFILSQGNLGLNTSVRFSAKKNRIVVLAH
jgi:bifunctional DNA-binding transcriptional regulator/antitoxin component of YhaV-PrlF toxin-antitoxin module